MCEEKTILGWLSINGRSGVSQSFLQCVSFFLTVFPELPNFLSRTRRHTCVKTILGWLSINGRWSGVSQCFLQCSLVPNLLSSLLALDPFLLISYSQCLIGRRWSNTATPFVFFLLLFFSFQNNNKIKTNSQNKPACAVLVSWSNLNTSTTRYGR